MNYISLILIEENQIVYGFFSATTQKKIIPISLNLEINIEVYLSGSNVVIPLD